MPRRSEPELRRVEPPDDARPDSSADDLRRVERPDELRRVERPDAELDAPCRVHGCHERARHLIDGDTSEPLPMTAKLPPRAVPLCDAHFEKLRAWK